MGRSVYLLLAFCMLGMLAQPSLQKKVSKEVEFAPEGELLNDVDDVSPSGAFAFSLSSDEGQFCPACLQLARQPGGRHTCRGRCSIRFQPCCCERRLCCCERHLYTFFRSNSVLLRAPGCCVLNAARGLRPPCDAANTLSPPAEQRAERTVGYCCCAPPPLSPVTQRTASQRSESTARS